MGSGTLDPRRQQSTVAGGVCDGCFADGVGGLEEPGDTLEHPSATSAGLIQDAFTDSGFDVRREAGDVRWGKSK